MRCWPCWGENGAGKSTLVSILFGHYLADSGTIEVDGELLKPGDTRAALAAGVGMVHQHFSLAANLSVLDNVMIGQESLTSWRSARAEFRQRLRAAADEYGLAVDPQALVRDLSVGERQRVEILKALLRGARYLILDEPTAVLTPGEVEQLFATLNRLVAKGLAVIFISHKLPEVLAVSHRVMVLRAGRVVAELPTAQASVDVLAQAMIGRTLTASGTVTAVEMTGETLRETASIPSGETTNQMTSQTTSQTTVEPASQPSDTRGKLALRVFQLSVSQAKRQVLNKVDFEVRRGEVLAIAGVAGNGQQPLAELLCGELSASHGTVEVFGRPMAASPSSWIAAGVARIPEDRLARGVVVDASLAENGVLDRYLDKRFCRWPQFSWLAHLLDRAAIRRHAQDIVTKFEVRHGGFDQAIRNLSGGNIQKFILGRELAGEPDLIIANQPTWGLDVGAVEYVHLQLRRARARGAAIVLISEDLDEIFGLADRIAVMYRGKLSLARTVADWSYARIGMAMAGQQVH